MWCWGKLLVMSNGAEENKKVYFLRTHKILRFRCKYFDHNLWPLHHEELSTADQVLESRNPSRRGALVRGVQAFTRRKGGGRALGIA